MNEICLLSNKKMHKISFFQIRKRFFTVKYFKIFSEYEDSSALVRIGQILFSHLTIIFFFMAMQVFAEFSLFKRKVNVFCSNIVEKKQLTVKNINKCCKKKTFFRITFATRWVIYILGILVYIFC